jgi:hypothetical protein
MALTLPGTRGKVMAMQAETLDLLEKSDVPSHQARAIARAIEIEIAASHQSLATQADLRDLRGEMQAMRVELRGEMQAMKGELLVTLQKAISEQTRWMFAGFITIIMMMIGYSFVNHLVA